MPNVSADEVLEQLQPIFQEVLDQPKLIVTRSSNASNTENWDSLAHIDLIEMVQQRFKVKFALGELQDLKEVGDLVRSLAEREDRRPALLWIITRGVHEAESDAALPQSCLWGCIRCRRP